jgi:hypothetical protein
MHFVKKKYSVGSGGWQIVEFVNQLSGIFKGTGRTAINLVDRFEFRP